MFFNSQAPAYHGENSLIRNKYKVKCRWLKDFLNKRKRNSFCVLKVNHKLNFLSAQEKEKKWYLLHFIIKLEPEFKGQIRA